MPKYVVTAPDGRKLQVTAPEGATTEQVRARAQQAYSGGNAAVGAGAPRDERGDFMKGVARGTDNMQGMTYGFAALLGDTIGHEGLTEWGLEGYQRNQQEAALSAPRVGSIREVKGVGDFFDYAQGVIGETAPFSLTTIAGGGVGGLLAKAAAKRLVTKGISEELAKKSVERILKDETKKKALEKLVKKGLTLEDVAKPFVPGEITSRIVKAGAAAGSFAASATTQQGGLYAELKEAGVDDAVLPAWAYGAGMGALDVLPELMLANKLLNPKTVSKELSKSFTRGLVGEVAKIGAKQMGAEALTESLQEGLALHARLMSDENFKWDDKANERLLDAAVAGAIAGAFLGGAGGGIAALTAKREGKKNATDTRRPAAGTAGAGQAAGAGTVPGVDAGHAGAGTAGRPEQGAGPAGPAAGGVDAAAATTAGQAGPAQAAAPAATAPAATVGGAVEPGNRAASPVPPPAARSAAEVASAPNDQGAPAGVAGGQPAPAAPAAGAAARTSLQVPDPDSGLLILQALQQSGVKAVLRGTTLEVPSDVAPAVQALIERRAAPSAAPAAPAQPAAPDASSAEPTTDYAAQLKDALNPETPRKGVYISAAGLKAAVPWLNQQIAKGLQPVRVQEKTGGVGVMLMPKDAAEEFVRRRDAGESTDALVGEWTGAAVMTLSKPETANPVVVQRKDESGAVVQETVVDGADPGQVEAATVLVGQNPGTVETTTPEQAVARREQMVAEEQASTIEPLVYTTLKRVNDFRAWLATDPPFLGDIDAVEDEDTRMALLAEKQVFLEWLNGRRGGKPSSHIRNAYNQYAEKRDREAERLAALDMPLNYAPNSTDEDLVESPPLTAEEATAARAILTEVSSWVSLASTKFRQVANALLHPNNRAVLGTLFQQLQGGESVGALTQRAIERVINPAAAAEYVRSRQRAPIEVDEVLEEPIDVTDGFGEIDTRDPSQIRIIGHNTQGPVFEGARYPRTKQERDVKGLPPHQQAKPWAERSQAEEVANEMAVRDRESSYSVVNLTAVEARQRGIDMPAMGKGWYVISTPRFGADMRFSKTFDLTLTDAQAAMVALRNGKRRFHDILPERLKKHPLYKYGIELVVDGEPATVATRDIVDLGFFVDPTLRAAARTDRQSALFHALLTGLNAMRLAGVQAAEGGAWPKITANLILEHKSGHRPVTLAKYLADRMYTGQEIRAVYDKGVQEYLRKFPKATKKAQEMAGERAKAAFFREEHPKRFAKAVTQAQALIDAGVVVSGEARANAARSQAQRIELMQTLADAESRLAALRDEEATRRTFGVPGRVGAEMDAEMAALTQEVEALREQLSRIDWREKSAGFDPRMDRVEEVTGDIEPTLGDQFARSNAIDEVDAIAQRAANPEGTAPAGAREQMIPSDERTTSPAAQGDNPAASFGGRLGSTLGTVPAGRTSGVMGTQIDSLLTPAPPPVPTRTLNEKGSMVAVPEPEVERRITSGGMPTRGYPSKPITEPSIVDDKGRTVNPAPEPAPAQPAPAVVNPGERAVSTPQALRAPEVKIAVLMQDTERGNVVREIARTIHNMLKIRQQLYFVDNADTAERVARVLGIDPRVARESATDTGQAGTAIYGTGATIIYLNPKAQGAQLAKTLAHEIGHVFFVEHWRGANTAMRQAITREHQAYLETPEGKAKHEARLKRKPGSTGYNLSEYIADQVAVYVNTDKKAASEVAKWYKQLALNLIEVFKWLKEKGFTQGANAEAFIRSVVAQPADTSTGSIEDSWFTSRADNDMMSDGPLSVQAVQDFLDANNISIETTPETPAADLFEKRAAINPNDPRRSTRVAAEFIGALALNHPAVRALKLRLRQTQVYRNARAEGRSDNGGIQHAVAVLTENALLGRTNATYPEPLQRLGEQMAGMVREGRQVLPNDQEPGTVRVDFADALARNPDGARIVQNMMAADPRFALAGSLAMAPQAAVYRNPDVMLHDIDFVFSGSTSEVSTIMARTFPNSVPLYDFVSGANRDTTLTFLVPPEGRTVQNLTRRPGGKLVIGYNVLDADGNVVGSFEKDAQTKKETYRGERAYPVDVFTNGVTQVQVDNAVQYESGGVTYRLAPYSSAVKAKLKYSRLKDSRDYAALRTRGSNRPVQSNVDFDLIEESVHPSFEALGPENDVLNDMNVEPEMPARGTGAEKFRNWWRAMRLRYPKIDQLSSATKDAYMYMHERFVARLFMRVKRMEIPEFDLMMRKFYSQITGDLTDEAAGAADFDKDFRGYLHAFMNRYRLITRNLDARTQNAVLMEAMSEQAPLGEGEVQTAVLQLQQLFRDALVYAEQAGLPLKKASEFYFPIVYDQAALADPAALAEIAAALERAGVIDPVNGVPYTAAQVEEMFAALRDEDTVIDLDVENDGGAEANVKAPWVQALRRRKIPEDVRKVIRQIPDENGAPKYMAKSLDYIVRSYFGQLVARGEWNKRMGDMDYNAKHRQWVDNGKQGPEPKFDTHKMLKAHLDRAQKGIDDNGEQTLKRATPEEAQFMLEAMAAMVGQYGRVNNPNARALMNGMQLFQNLRTLTFVVLSSVPDIANNFIQTGEFRDTWRVMRESMGAALRGEMDDTLAMFGYANDALDASFLEELSALRDADSKIHKANAVFFKAIQLHRWTNFTRSLGLKTSLHYIQKHNQLAWDENGNVANQDSANRMAELGLQFGDVQAWIDGDMQTKFTGATSEGAARVTAAVQHMVDSIVLHPAPAEKTLWGNAEYMKLLWHLKGFMYAFSTRVIGRGVDRIIRNGVSAESAVQVAALAMLLPFAAFGLALRDALQYWVWGKEAYTPYDDPLAYLGVLAGRSGITGFAQYGVDVWQASDRGRAPALAVMGPTVTWMNDFLEYPLHKTVPGSIPIIASIPGARNEIGAWIKGDE